MHQISVTLCAPSMSTVSCPPACTVSSGQLHPMPPLHAAAQYTIHVCHRHAIVCVCVCAIIVWVSKNRIQSYGLIPLVSRFLAHCQCVYMCNSKKHHLKSAPLVAIVGQPDSSPDVLVETLTKHMVAQLQRDPAKPNYACSMPTTPKSDSSCTCLHGCIVLNLFVHYLV